ncbi:hypothetical protein TSTA_060360 [Talaromyces stipitatus ATCC 10500]|uniref:RING-type domain-containing protein n=1 Tax=Talaromyces stipitatus (strain ATCC 10500 / CBS 375.48 / QM 6759 / NRRL 1006) TaxID=441959 RepID=B8LU69_TALSN|nr:uncharacterized protein TSTA_060360 [Talaromyces stipitatus ATCC 10500]EED22541.1 hypothetical protein TSTA_060360 [Talaromyces stipitatus ATCC 10500]
MEGQQQPAYFLVSDLHIPRFTHGGEGESLATEAAAQTSLGSPPSTIPFDEELPPLQLSSERLSPGEESSGVQNLRIPVIEISENEGDSSTLLSQPSRPRRRNTRHLDYAYRDYQATMDHAISTSSLGKRGREDSDTPSFPSKIRQLVTEIQGQYEALEKQNEQSAQERHRWKEERDRWKKKKDEWKKKERELHRQIQFLQRQINEQKRRNILKCVVCHRTFNENWNVFSCGHTLCKDCVDDIHSKGSLFKYSCVQCERPIQACFDFYPNVVEA